MPSVIELVSLLLISLFVPFFIILGVKLYKYQNIQKLVKILTVSVLLNELIRFFYNARLYEDARLPSENVKLGLLFFVVLTLFSTFSTKKIFKQGFYLTVFYPLVYALFNRYTFTDPSDNYTIIPAFFSIEIGLILTIFILNIKEYIASFNKFSFIPAGVILVLSFIAVFSTNLWWRNSSFIDLYQLLGLGLMLVSSVVIYLVFLFLNKKYTQKDSTDTALTEENIAQ